MNIPKLSEAILLGSVSTPQGFHGGSMYEGYPGKCAFGAALLACGKTYAITDTAAPYDDIKEFWPWVSREISHPICDDVTSRQKWDTMAIVLHLNDFYRWTRPQIAAWVATIEPQDDVIPTTESSTEIVHDQR